MPKRVLPKNVPEIGYIYISLGLDPDGGTSVGQTYEGMTIEAAIGYLIAYSDVLRRDNEASWNLVTAGINSAEDYELFDEESDEDYDEEEDDE